MPAGFAKVDDRLTNVDEQFAQVNNRFVRADEDLARIREEGRQGDEETRRFHARAARGRHRADRRARRATFRCSLSQVGTPRLASTPAAALSFAVIGERVRDSWASTRCSSPGRSSAPRTGTRIVPSNDPAAQPGARVMSLNCSSV